MRNNEPRSIGLLRKHARVPFDAITRQELSEHLRELIDNPQAFGPDIATEAILTR